MKKGICAVLFIFLILSTSAEPVAASNEFISHADTAMTSKRYMDARELYRQAFAESNENPEKARALLGIAKADYYLKNYYESDINLKRFFRTYRNSAQTEEAHLIWGLVLMNIRKYRDAEEQLNLVKGELQDRAIIAKAEIAFIQGETERAERLLSKIDSKTYDSNNRVIYLRASILSKRGQNEQAIKTINRIPDQALKAENLAVSKAIIYYNARKYAEAKDMLKAIINADSSRIELIQAKRTLFRIYEAEGNEDAALKTAMELMRYEADDELRLDAVSLFEQKGDLDSAFRFLTYLRNKKTLSEEIEKRLKKLQHDKNAKADEYLLKYFFYIGIDSPYAIEAAKYMEGKGYKEQAVRLLQKATKGRNGAEASILLAKIFMNDRKFADAKRLLLPVTTDANYSGQALLLLYKVLENEGNMSEAVEYRTRAIRVLEAQKDYSNAGDLFLMSGNNAEALKNYLRAAHKGDTISMLKAADLYYMKGKRDAAKTYYKKAIDAGIKDAKSLHWAEYQYGKLARSDEYLKKAEAGSGAVAEAAGLLRSGK